VATAKCRPTASEALKHGWLNGAAYKHQHLQAAPHRLKQLINGRKLKVYMYMLQSMCEISHFTPFQSFHEMTVSLGHFA